MKDLLNFLNNNRSELFEQSLEHVGLTFLSLLLAVAIALPLGIWISRNEKWSGPVLGIAGVFQTIPSIALLGFLIPILGIGVKPAIFALFLYAILPILRNTFTGIKQVDPAVIEAAQGMGMTPNQVLRKVELPLALPTIFAGIRTATVINVGVATLAAYIGAGGLGEFIFGGIALNNANMILAGAIPAALLAIFFDQVLGFFQRKGVRNLFRFSRIGLLLLPLLSAAWLIPDMRHNGLKAGFAPEFMGREDGYRKLVDTYQLDFNTVVLNSAMMYPAVRDELVDVIVGYSTDGRIKAFDLVLLEDNKHVFPPYECAPVIREETLVQYPGIETLLNKLAGRINDSIMTSLNYQVDFLKESPALVARRFLESIDLYRPDQKTGGPTIVIGSKVFTEQYILAEIYGMLIDGFSNYDVDLKTGLGGTKICFESLVQGEIDFYPEYTGTGFLVLLTPDELTTNKLITSPEGVFDYVRSEFQQQYKLRWLGALGFNNTYALMVRAEQAKSVGWQTIEDLK